MRERIFLMSRRIFVFITLITVVIEIFLHGTESSLIIRCIKVVTALMVIYCFIFRIIAFLQYFYDNIDIGILWLGIIFGISMKDIGPSILISCIKGIGIVMAFDWLILCIMKPFGYMNRRIVMAIISIAFVLSILSESESVASTLIRCAEMTMGFITFYYFIIIRMKLIRIRLIRIN